MKAWIWVVVLLLAGPAMAERNYRYIDRQGNVIVASSINDEALERGYQVIDSRGRVIAEISPRMTDEQQRQLLLSERDESLARQRDEELLRLYRHAEDVERAKRNVLARAELNIANLHARIADRRSNLASLQLEAAQQERRSGEVTTELVTRIRQIEQQIEGFYAEIEATEEQMTITDLQFEADKRRLVYLLEQQQRRLQEALDAAQRNRSPSRRE